MGPTLTNLSTKSHNSCRCLSHDYLLTCAWTHDTHAHTHTHTHTHTNMHTHTHTHTRARAHAHTRTHTHRPSYRRKASNIRSSYKARHRGPNSCSDSQSGEPELRPSGAADDVTGSVAARQCVKCADVRDTRQL